MADGLYSTRAPTFTNSGERPATRHAASVCGFTPNASAADRLSSRVSIDTFGTSWLTVNAPRLAYGQRST